MGPTCCWWRFPVATKHSHFSGLAVGRPHSIWIAQSSPSPRRISRGSWRTWRQWGSPCYQSKHGISDFFYHNSLIRWICHVFTVALIEYSLPLFLKLGHGFIYIPYTSMHVKSTCTKDVARKSGSEVPNLRVDSLMFLPWSLMMFQIKNFLFWNVLKWFYFQILLIPRKERGFYMVLYKYLYIYNIVSARDKHFESSGSKQSQGWCNGKPTCLKYHPESIKVKGIQKLRKHIPSTKIRLEQHIQLTVLIW